MYRSILLFSFVLYILIHCDEDICLFVFTKRSRESYWECISEKENKRQQQQPKEATIFPNRKGKKRNIHFTWLVPFGNSDRLLNLKKKQIQWSSSSNNTILRFSSPTNDKGDVLILTFFSYVAMHIPEISDVRKVKIYWTDFPHKFFEFAIFFTNC